MIKTKRGFGEAQEVDVPQRYFVPAGTVSMRVSRRPGPRYLYQSARDGRPGRLSPVPPGITRVGAQAEADLVIAHPTVSRMHCEIHNAAGRITVRDVGSKNGVWIQGVRVPEGEVTVGQVLRLGQVELLLLDGPEEPSPVGGEVLPGIVGTSPLMRQLGRQVHRLAGTDLGILITGETGSGKELVARALHELGRRRSGPFVPLNCSALPADLMEAELFGHERGAFTGAAVARGGLLEAAAGGTLFLDEIAELPLSQQPKLLRVLETRQVRRLGSQQGRFVDVRLVAATHADLEAEAVTGHFRPDLLYRIREATVRIPSLRERREDIPLLVQHFVQEVRRDPSLPEPQPADPEWVARLARLAFPGNVRELRSLVRRAAVLGWTDVLPASVKGGTGAADGAPKPLHAAPLVEGVAEPRASYEVALPDLERRLILDAFERADGNKSRAARLLGMPKSTYSDRLKRILRTGAVANLGRGAGRG